jgi:hypothetical protein
MKYTEKCLKKRGWKYVCEFGFTSEMWRKGRYYILVDKKTRRLILTAKR